MIMRATLPQGRAEHLLWAMERAHPEANAGASTVPLPIVTSPASAKVGPSMRAGAFSPQIEARLTEISRQPEKEIFGRARRDHEGR
jgi:hypothetical protein